MNVPNATSNDFQVVIVGFGPTGALAANLLGRSGIRTLVIDQADEVYDKPRAIAIDHEIVRILDNLELLPKIARYIAPFPASEHFGADGQLIRRIDMVNPPYPLGYTPSMVFSQPQVETALREHATSNACVTVELSTEFLGFQETEDGVVFRVRDPDGRRRVRTADYVIACDGASSSVRQHLGIVLEDLIFDEPWLVIDVLMHDQCLGKLSSQAANYCDPSRPAAYIIGPGNHRRWEIMLLPGEDPQKMQDAEQVWKLLSRWIRRSDGTIWRAASYRFHALVAQHWRKGRIFLAGDAAHQQPPFIGQGMCQGMRDAANLAWRMERVLCGSSSEAILDSYELERNEHVRYLTAKIKTIGEYVCERDPEAARARDVKILAEGGGEPKTITRQEIVPPLSCGLLGPGASKAIGTLFPQPWIRTGYGRALMDSVHGVGWRLVVDARAQMRLSSSLASEVSQLGFRVISLRDPNSDLGDNVSAPKGELTELDGVLAKWFEDHACAVAVVRPDHYVYATASIESELVSVLHLLKRHLQ